MQTFVVAIPANFITDPQQAARTHQSVAERLAQVPGVTSVGLSSSITMDGEDNGNYLMVEEFPDPEGTVAEAAALQELRARATSRRWATAWSRAAPSRGTRSTSGRLVIVISETLAREYWKEPATSARQARALLQSEMPWREIVGVAGDERDDGLNQPATAIVYWPMLNESYRWRTMAYAVRSNRVGTPGFLRELQQAVWSVNPNLPLADIQTLEEIQASSMAQTSFALVMLGDCRRRRAADRRGRNLRRDRLRGGAADARDWHPHGARRAGRRRATDVPAPGAVADGHRHRARHRRRRSASRA